MLGYVDRSHSSSLVAHVWILRLYAIRTYKTISQTCYSCLDFKRDARKVKDVVIIEDDNPYDMEEMLMPLHKYLNTPTAHDIIHNGATFQVLFLVVCFSFSSCESRFPEHIHFNSQIAGLTNNSHLAEAHDVRHCVQKYKSLGDPVLQVAKVVTLVVHRNA